jgi:S1-C subfamily serine protease
MLKVFLATVSVGALLIGGGAFTQAAAPALAKSSDVEKRLDEARQRLDAAAHEVAELSMQSGNMPPHPMFMVHNFEGRRAALGIVLDAEREPAKGEGARVLSVSPGGPAEQAGLKTGDMIVTVDGTDIRSDGKNSAARNLITRMTQVEPEQKIKLEYRRDGRVSTTTVTARPMQEMIGEGRFPDFAGPFDMPGLPMDIPFGGEFFEHRIADLELATMSAKLGSYFGATRGVLVTHAPADTGFKLEDGDVLMAIDSREPENAAHALRILRSYSPGEKVSLKVMRMHKELSLTAVMPQRRPRPRIPGPPQRPKMPGRPSPPERPGPEDPTDT